MATIEHRAAGFDRVAVVHDIAGPRVRLAVVWTALVFGALFAAGSTGLAIVFGATAAIGSLQVAARWRQVAEPANQLLAAAGAGLVVLASALGNAWCGLAILAYTVASIVFPDGFERLPFLSSSSQSSSNRSSSNAGDETGLDRLRLGVAHAANTLGPGLAMGLAGAAAIQAARVENMAFLFLLIAVSTYDAGDFLCGAGYSSRLVGPLAGMLGVAVVTATMYVAEPPPFRADQTLWAGGVLAVACPLGQWLASWLLPSARAKAPGLRRLDSWIVSGPAFVVILWAVDH